MSRTMMADAIAHDMAVNHAGNMAREQAANLPLDVWVTVTADKALYVDFGRDVVACDRLPSPITLILKNPATA